MWPKENGGEETKIKGFDLSIGCSFVGSYLTLHHKKSKMMAL